MTVEVVTEDQVWHVDCGYDDAPHIFPIDWVFGGPNELHPGADPRWMPTTYQYHDANLQAIFVTQTPLCDEEAIDNFTWVASLGKGFNPAYITVKRPGEAKFTMLPVKYDKTTDTASDT